MKFSHFFLAANALVKTKVFKIKVPLAISWALTFRCNQRCLYCAVWQHQCSELDTPEILNMIDKFTQLGTRWISFTGGEPLLREDLGEIVRYAKGKGVYVSLSSNGRLVSEKIHALRYLDAIKLSLDGPAHIHDYIRGKGSCNKVLEAIELCHKHEISVYLQYVISKANLDWLDWVLHIASRYNTKVLFQPATKSLLWSEEPNSMSPPIDKYKIAIAHLIYKKKEGAPIYNSLVGLQHLHYWPEHRKIFCTAGLLSFDVGPDGTILACNRKQRTLSEKSEEDVNIRKALKKINLIKDCDQCWCSSVVEFNLMSSFNINAIINFLRNL